MDQLKLTPSASLGMAPGLPSPTCLEFEVADDCKPSHLSKCKLSIKRRRAAAPFASMTMQHNATPSGSRKGPAFTIASAVESNPLNLEGVPQWRIAAGNLAAGATAGCAVEAALYPIGAPPMGASLHAHTAWRLSL